jgi:hypothetical protein
VIHDWGMCVPFANPTKSTLDFKFTLTCIFASRHFATDRPLDPHLEPPP